MVEVPGWLAETLTGLLNQASSNALPHGLLVIGHPGDGSGQFSEALIAGLMCHQPTPSACGMCKSCQLWQAGTHPDFLKVEPEGKSHTIKVDAIRNINQKVSATAQQGGNKVIYLSAAQTMNINAANALLKVLEEPTPNTFIILESDELSRTLPTIRSRCRIVKLPEPAISEALFFLQHTQVEVDHQTALGITNGHPLLAAKVTAEEITAWYDREQQFFGVAGFSSLSQYINSVDMEPLLNQILLWLDTSIRSRQNLEIGLAPVSPALLQSMATIPGVSLFRFRDYIVEKLATFTRQSNLNTQLMAEELASRWLSLRGVQ